MSNDKRVKAISRYALQRALRLAEAEYRKAVNKGQPMRVIRERASQVQALKDLQPGKTLRPNRRSA